MTVSDWSPFPVPTLAGFLSGPIEPAWSQVGAWRGTHNILIDAAAALARARADLAAVWPPEGSEAAARFIDFADSLTRSMRTTAEAAHANGVALQNTLTALTDAKTQVDELHDTWRTYAAQTGGEIDEAGSADEAAAVPAGWSAQLNARAQARMATTDQIIFDNMRALVVPATYLPQAADFGVIPLTTPSSGPSISSTKPGDPHPISAVGKGSGPTPRNPIARHFPGSFTKLPPVRLIEAPPDGAITFPPSRPPSVTESTSSIHGVDGVDPDVAQGTGRQTSFARSRTLGADPGGSASLTDERVVAASAYPPPASSAQGMSDGSGVFLPGVSSASADGGSRTGRRRGNRTAWPVSTGVPAIIAADGQCEHHDPGPGVIGIDR